MGKRGFITFCVFIGTQFLTPQAVAEARCNPNNQICLVAGNFIEHFYGSAPVRVSGNLIVGVSLTGGSSFKPGEVKVSLAGRPTAGRLCLSVASRDGRYYAENLYTVPAVRSGPAAFFFPTEYLTEILSYKQGDLAVLIRDTEHCEAASFGTIIPSTEGTGVPDHLRISLNAPATRAQVSLLVGETEVARAENCEADRNRNSLAFSAVCALALPSGQLHGPYTLRIIVRERMANDEMRIPLSLSLP